jgi:hypothetical protein
MGSTRERVAIAEVGAASRYCHAAAFRAPTRRTFPYFCWMKLRDV